MKTKLITIIVLSLFQSHYNLYSYMPNIHNIPLFKEQNEFTATITGGGNPMQYFEDASLELQGAYSITDKTSVMADFMLGEDHRYRDLYLDVGYGYYKPFGKYGVFEISSGLALDYRFTQHSDNSNYSSSTWFVKPFIQPSIGLTNRGFDIALSGRICALKYFGIVNNIYAFEYQYITSYLIEPAITVRFGWKWIKYQLQYCQSIYLINPKFSSPSINLSLGWSLDIADRIRRDTLNDPNSSVNKWKDRRNKTKRRSGADLKD